MGEEMKGVGEEMKVARADAGGAAAWGMAGECNAVGGAWIGSAVLRVALQTALTARRRRQTSHVAHPLASLVSEIEPYCQDKWLEIFGRFSSNL